MRDESSVVIVFVVVGIVVVAAISSASLSFVCALNRPPSCGGIGLEQPPLESMPDPGAIVWCVEFQDTLSEDYRWLAGNEHGKELGDGDDADINGDGV